jgi:DHA1 family inner membrane transport protein
MPLLFLLSAGTLAVGIGAFGVIGVITPLSRDLALTPVGAGWVMSAYAVAYAIGSPLGTSLTGRYERRDVLVAGMALFAVGALISALAGSATTLYAGRIVMALGSGLYSPAAAGVAIAAVAPERRGKALATVYGGLTLAQVIGIPVGSYVGYTIGWPWLFLAVTAGAAAMAVALFVQVPRKIQVAPATLSDLFAAMTDLRLAIALLLTVTTMGAAWIPYTFLAPIIEEKTGAGPEVVGLLLVIYGLGSMAGNALGGFLTDRIGAVKALTVAAIGPIPFMAALTFLPWGPFLGAFILFGWAGVGWSIAVAQQSRLVGLDPARTQVLLSLNAACIYVGAALGSSLAGQAKSLGGIPALGVAAVTLGLIGVAHLALTVRLSGAKAS